MEKNILTLDKKKRIILITICSVLLILLLLLIFYMVSHGGKGSKDDIDSVNRLNGVYIVSGSLVEGNHHALTNQKCFDDNSFCVEKIDFIYNGSKGHIVLTLYNYNPDKTDGEFTLTFGDYSFVIPYRNIGTGAEIVRTFGYDGWDIDYASVTDYEITAGGIEEKNTIFDELSDEDKSRIISFYNPSN